MHFDFQQLTGGLLGVSTSLCAIFVQIIPVQTALQTAVCAAIGAGTGFIVTYIFKKITGWVEKKLSIKDENDN